VGTARVPGVDASKSYGLEKGGLGVSQGARYHGWGRALKRASGPGCGEKKRRIGSSPIGGWNCLESIPGQQQYKEVLRTPDKSVGWSSVREQATPRTPWGLNGFTVVGKAGGEGSGERSKCGGVLGILLGSGG